MRKNNFGRKNDKKSMENTVEIVELFDNIYLHQRHLTSGQMDFLRGAKRHFQKNKELSNKQLLILQDILKYLPQDEPIRTTHNR